MHLRLRHRAPRNNRPRRPRQRPQQADGVLAPPAPPLTMLTLLGKIVAEGAAVPAAAAGVAAVGSAVQHCWPEGTPGAGAVFAAATLMVWKLVRAASTAYCRNHEPWPDTVQVTVIMVMLYGAVKGYANSLWPFVGAVCGGAMMSAMGAVMMVFEDARARGVQERRFAPNDVLLLTQTPRWVVIACGVGWSLVPAPDRFILLLGVTFGMDMVGATLFRNSVVANNDAPQHCQNWVVVSNDVSQLALAALIVFHSHAAWFSVVPPVWLAVYVAGARHNPRNIVRALRRACRVAWYGVPPLPRDAQCCVCWADVGSGGDGAATLCTECGVGASTPMSYACEPCRSGWRAVRDECPVCLAAGWPVCNVI